MKEFEIYKNKLTTVFKKWSNKYTYRLIIFNIIVISLFLLRSAGYFQPYFPISVNLIVVGGLILSIFLLDVDSKAIFAVTFFFWIFAALLKVLQIDVWTERTSVYAFETLMVGVIIFIVENFYQKYK